MEIPAARDETTMIVEDLASSVEGRAIQGYHPKLMIAGTSYEASPSLFSGGPNREWLSLKNKDSLVANFRRMASNLANNVKQGKEEFYPYIDQMLMAVVDLPQETVLGQEKKIVLVSLFHDSTKFNNRAGRETEQLTLAFSLPARKAEKLEAEVSGHPDLLEDLYQKIWPGMDSKGEEHGLERYKSEGVILFSPEQLQFKEAGLEPFNKQDLKKILEGGRKFEFKNGPYGVKEFKHVK